MMQNTTGQRGGGWIRRGVKAAYHREPQKPLLVVSDPYEYNGLTVVTARTCERSKKARSVGMYSVDALIEYREDDD